MLALVALACAGCGSRPAVVPVTITVTYKGEPVAGARVAVMPLQGRPAYGTTDEQGKCGMTTFAPGDGVAPGKHTVAVSKQVEIPPDQRSADYRPGGRLSHHVPMRDVLPTKYGSPLESPLEIDVTYDGDNAFTLVIED